jgi:hypothetical protein
MSSHGKQQGLDREMFYRDAFVWKIAASVKAATAPV